MKSIGTIQVGTGLWETPNYETNESSFSGLPDGDRNYNGAFGIIGHYNNWWSATESKTTSAWSRGLNYSYTDIHKGYGNKEIGVSVRCVKD